MNWKKNGTNMILHQTDRIIWIFLVQLLNKKFLDVVERQANFNHSQMRALQKKLYHGQKWEMN